MISIRLAPRDDRPEVVEQPRTGNKPAPTRAVNLGAMLDLGNTIYFAFRGRAYGVPPLPWLEGEKLLDAWLAATAYGDTLKHEDLPGYYECFRKLSKLIWSNIRPVGKIRRLLKRLGLLRNPWAAATEREVADLALFLLERRMSTFEPESLTTKRSSARAT